MALEVGRRIDQQRVAGWLSVVRFRWLPRFILLLLDDMEREINGLFLLFTYHTSFIVI
jgi:hypothetical protein